MLTKLLIRLTFPYIYYQKHDSHVQAYTQNEALR